MYSFDEGQALLLSAAKVHHREMYTTPERKTNWQIWTDQLRGKLSGNFFSGIESDEHFKLKLSEGEAPFILPIYSVHGFDNTIQYRESTLTHLWKQCATEDLTPMLKEAYSVQANASLHAAIAEGDGIFAETQQPVLPHFAFGWEDAAHFIKKGLPTIVSPTSVGECIYDALYN